MGIGRVVMSSVILYVIVKSALIFNEESRSLQLKNELSWTETERVRLCSTNLLRNVNINFLQGKTEPKTKIIGKRLNYYPNSTKTFRLIQVCGDIELNPGPVVRSKEGDGRK